MTADLWQPDTGARNKFLPTNLCILMCVSFLLNANLHLIEVGGPVVKCQKKTRRIRDCLLMTLTVWNNHKTAFETQMADRFINAASLPAHSHVNGKNMQSSSRFLTETWKKIDD